MDLNWLETVLYGLVAGICEFLPVSSQAHCSILRCLFGQNDENVLLSLLAHVGVLVALIICTRTQLGRMYREYMITKMPKHRRRRFADTQCIRDISLLKLALVPIVLSFLIYPLVSNWRDKLYMIALMLFLNGVLLHVPMYIPVGNKDSRGMSRLDGLLIGLGGALAVLPGLSPIATTFSVAAVRGADLQQAYKWSLVLSIPVLIIRILIDCFAIVTGSLTGVDFLFVLQCIVSAGFAYLGAYGGIFIMRSLVQRTGMHTFSYYCVGAALFAFILYLI